MATQLLIEVSDLGGLGQVLLAGGFAAYIILGAPFRDLELAIGFNTMKSRICREEGILNRSNEAQPSVGAPNNQAGAPNQEQQVSC